MNLPGDLRVLRGQKLLHLLRQGGEPLVPLPRDANAVLLTRDEVERCRFRTPLPGDRLRPFGAPGEKPLRRFLTDRRLDAPLRPTLWLLADDHHILWIPGMVSSESLRRASAQGLWRLCCRPVPCTGLSSDHKE